MIKAIIFDLDGTLYDKKGFIWKMPIRLFNSVSFLTATIKERDFIAGKDFGDGESLLNELGQKISPHSPDKWKNWYQRKFYKSFISLLKPSLVRSGLEPFLKDVRQLGVRLAVLSDYAFVKERLLALSIDPEYFDAIVSSEAEGALKPAPRPFLNIARELEVEPRECLIIGDRRDTDEAGAEAAKMTSLIISKENSWESILKASKVLITDI